MKYIKNITKKGKLTIKKTEAYKTIWQAELEILGTKEQKVYYREFYPTQPTQGLRFKIGEEDIKLDRWCAKPSSTTIQLRTNNCNKIVLAILEDNIDWITKSICNKTKTMEYSKIYGGYSKGCYELSIKVEEKC